MKKRILKTVVAAALVASGGATLACSTDIEGPKLKSNDDEDETPDTGHTSMLPGEPGAPEMLARVLFPPADPRG